MVSVPKLWPGATIVCIGGGPSLTVDDVASVRGRARVIAINDAYRLAPWADVLYGCDGKFWKWQHRLHADKIAAFQGLKFGLTHEAKKWPGVQILANTGNEGLELANTGLRNGRNSGYQAINLAVHLGARRIVLLGYDMAIGDDGRTHWFGDHPDRGRSPYRVFRPLFATLVQPLQDLGIDIINCSRRTKLVCFPQQTLETALPAPACAEVA